MKSIRMLALATMMLCTFSASQAQAKDIVETAETAGSFKTLVAAVKAAGLAETLQGKGPFTVFAPSSYLATVTFVDHLIGNLLKELDQSNHAQNTWIVLWSDHGWYLGEKEHWGKATGWYRATRVPLMIVPPASARPEGFHAGSRCVRPVNLLDLFPTVAEMARQKPEKELEGRSLLPLVSDPDQKWSDHTITTFGRGNHAVTTNRWRFIQYFDGSAEIYDRSADPNEWHNLIASSKGAAAASRLRRLVPKETRWKHFIRYGTFKAVVPADGSPMLLFNHAVENHLEERTDESKKFPQVVRDITSYLQAHPDAPKRLVITKR